MSIRIAIYHDAPAIKILLEVLGYKTSTNILGYQLKTMFDKDEHRGICI